MTGRPSKALRLLNRRRPGSLAEDDSVPPLLSCEGWDGGERGRDLWSDEAFSSNGDFSPPSSLKNVIMPRSETLRRLSSL